ncbi:gfo/Idh/MocA family oxidoreductase [Candidatus Poribacteria bacterium]|nr:gfo/Idh/MocA family oxidoreductase [Candidatus Poribacteria bacterium]
MKMASKDIIKVGIVGAGGIARGAHMPGYLAVPDAKVVAVCDIKEEVAKKFAKDFDIKHVFTNYEKMMEMDELDAVSVCTPNNFHAGPTVAALEADKHVLCEKPIAGTSDHGQLMVDAAKENKKILQIGLHLRFQESSKLIKKYIEDGVLGEIYYARAVAMRRRGIPSWGAFVRKDMSTGGPLVDIGVHQLDLMVWLMGCPKPVGAAGHAYTKMGDRGDVAPGDWGMWDYENFDVEDFAVAYIKFENELTATLETSWAGHFGNVGPSFIMGDKGGICLSPFQINTDKNGVMVDITPQIPRQTEDPHTTEVKAFIKAIKEDAPSPVPGEEALEITKIFDAVYKSTRTGTMVHIR